MSSTLKKLTLSALSIPGMLSSAQAAGPAESETSYRYTFYQEDDSPASRDDSGLAQDRYTIQVHQFYLLMPLADKYSVSLESSYEHMSGASPAYSYIASGSDEVTTHFVGASKEQRYDLKASARQYGSTSELGVGSYISVERDYYALSGSLDGSVQINNQMTTLSGGVSAGWDKMNPTTLADEGSTEQSVTEPARYNGIDKTKWQLSLFEGVGHIVSRNLVVQASASFTYKSGYLSDPYRDCPHAADVPCDIRPSTRSMGTLFLGARHYLPIVNAALHVDYRLFVDSWDLLSHTVEMDYYQTWAPGLGFFRSNDIYFQFIPGVRYYLQNDAYFYEVPDLNLAEPFYTVDTLEYYSSDPRLGQYGAISSKFSWRMNVRSLTLDANIERYVANPAFGFNGEEDMPGLPAFWRFGTGVDFRF